MDGQRDSSATGTENSVGRQKPLLLRSTKKKGDIFDNMLIFGDNLLALKSLEQHYTGKVKCIYIDPPYNTGSAFEHYDDGVEHSIWLGLMRDRISIIHHLLRPDGFFCCHIDDSEGSYLKVMLDEIFGRDNYLTTFFIQVRYPEKTLKQDMAFHKEIEQVHIYRKQHDAVPNQNERTASFEKFKYYFVEKGSGKEIELGGKRVIVFQSGEYDIIEKEGSEEGRKGIWASGTILDGNSSGRFFRDYLTGRASIDGLGVLYKVYGIGDDKFDFRYFTGPKKEGASKGKYYQGVPLAQLEAPEKKVLSPIENFYDMAGNFGNCRLEGGVDFRSGKKPEILLQISFKHFTKPGDLVLDSFLGSGTTAAVAHKMGRRWIGIELGEHCHTHCIPRLKKVIDGEDKGGITESVGWLGSGGFRYFRLAPSLLKKDKYDNWIINPEYNAEMLSEAVCKLNGYTYAPNEDVYWKQGESVQGCYIYVTTQSLSIARLQELSEEVGSNNRLLVVCKAFRGKSNDYPNMVVKKIPKSVLEKCEWDHDDYSLKVENLPTTPKKKSKMPLFDSLDDVDGADK